MQPTPKITDLEFQFFSDATPENPHPNADQISDSLGEFCMAQDFVAGDVFSVDEVWSRPRSFKVISRDGDVWTFQDLSVPQANPGHFVEAELPRQSFQARVGAFMAHLGKHQALNVERRRNRFLEEALEAVQAAGMQIADAYQLVDYVFRRSAGDLEMEIGDVLFALAAMATAGDVIVSTAGERALTRVWQRIDSIRAKVAAESADSPLPGQIGEA